jgi:hypothetical protein
VRFSNWAQGSEEWLAERRGVITASRFRDALDRTKKGELTAKAELYAMDLARERCGGSVFGPYVNAQMRWGTEQEPFARMEYEIANDRLVSEVGFFKTEDGLFGVSVDGIVEDEGAIEIKSIASSDMLYTVLVEKDYSHYVHQVTATMWLLRLQWCDLVLWTPDLAKKMRVVRFPRDEDFIEKMERDLIEFSRIVAGYETKLRKALEA